MADRFSAPINVVARERGHDIQLTMHICQRCGALVGMPFLERHDAWHEECKTAIREVTIVGRHEAGDCHCV